MWGSGEAEEEFPGKLMEIRLRNEIVQVISKR